MAGKYGEPWEVSPLNGRIVDSGREFLSSWENRRACACVNALEGIANPQAVKAVIEAAKEFCGSVTLENCRRLADALEILGAPDSKPNQATEALRQIAAYDSGNGCCQYGCDTPTIAQRALAALEKTE